jgi:transcriptional regulator with XRE-family HTH domain
MPTTERATAGDVVRARREELGLTKAELARRAHLTRSTIHEIEAGQRVTLQLRTLQALARALDMPPENLHQGRAPQVFSHALSDSLRRDIEERLGESRRYEDVLELLLRVARKVEELEERLQASA